MTNESNLEIIADTGSEEDLISHSDLEVHFKDKAKKIPSSPVSLITAGKKCMEQGFSFPWPTGEAPYFISPNGQKVRCQLRGNVPVFGNRGPLISCPAATSSTKDCSRVAPTSVSNEAGLR